MVSDCFSNRIEPLAKFADPSIRTCGALRMCKFRFYFCSNLKVQQINGIKKRKGLLKTIVL